MHNEFEREKYIESLSYDSRLADCDLRGSIAHAQMLVRTGILPAADGRRIVTALRAMRAAWKAGSLRLAGEDVHMALEAELIRRIGSVGGKLHTARSRNDQVVLDMKLYLKEVIIAQRRRIARVVEGMIALAERDGRAVMPGYTHLQEAQPVSFGHYALSFAWMLLRDRERLSDCARRMDENPLGAAALAGTTFPIDRQATARSLGFRGVTANSIDTVSDRDFILEYLGALAISGTHLSRLAEDFIVWASSAFGFITLPAEYSSGSSIMPQKRNPDYLELLRGRCGLLIGDLTALLTIMKGLPLSYNRDMQEDKRIMFRAADLYDGSLMMLGGFLKRVRVNPGRMRDACRRGFLEATDLADYLAARGVPFRTAHGIVRRIVGHAVAARMQLAELPIETLRRFSPAFTRDVYAVMTPAAMVARRRSVGGAGGDTLRRQVRLLRARLRTGDER